MLNHDIMDAVEVRIMADLKVMKRCPNCGTLNDDDSLFCMNCRCDLSSVAAVPIDEEPTDSFFTEEIENHDNKQNLERPNTEMYEGIIPPIRESESATESMAHTTSSIPVIPPINNPEPKKDYKKYYIYGGIAALLLVAGIGLMFFMNRGESQISAYDAHITQGQKYVAEKKYEAAIDEFEQAKKIDPKKEEAYENLYYTYEKQGDIKQQQFIYNEYNIETGKTQKDMQEAQKEIYIIIIETDPVDPEPTKPEEPVTPPSYDEDAPVLEQWENVTDWNAFESSKEYTYEIRWSAVNEAEGYEFNYAIEKDTTTELTEDIKDTKFSIKFKDYEGFLAKVRAFKTVDGQKVYTPWSVIQAMDKDAVQKECDQLNPFIEQKPEEEKKEEEKKEDEFGSVDDLNDIDALFDAFLKNEIPAYNKQGGEIWFKNLQNAQEHERYAQGKRVDLDNDGEQELILTGGSATYGGMYLDAKDGKIVCFEQGEGTTGILGYGYYDGKAVICHSDTSHAGRNVYTFTVYNGADTIEDTFDLKAEYYNMSPDRYDNKDAKLTFKGQTITLQEYENLLREIFADSDPDYPFLLSDAAPSENEKTEPVEVEQPKTETEKEETQTAPVESTNDQKESEVPVEQYPKDITMDDLLEEVYEKYVFSNGLGWRTEVQIYADGTIKGHYFYETFESGEGYDVTRTESYFTAKLKNIKKTKDGVFTAEFTEYQSENPTSSDQIIEEGSTKIKVVYMEKTYGFDNCKTLTFYGPDTPITEFTDKQREYLPDQNMTGDYGWLLNNEDNYLMWGTTE